jgi:phosphoglycolate phosphatase
MEAIKLVIFDLDGTLVDAYQAIVESLNYTLRRLKYSSQAASVIRRAVGWGDESLLRPFLKPEDLEKALLLYRRHHKESLLRGSRLFPQAKMVLGYLEKKGYMLAVASNRPTKFSWILIHHLGLAHFFREVLCADELKKGKPHPEILHKIMRKLRALPKETLYVGDMAIDAQTARCAGVRAIIVTGGSSTMKEIKKERPQRIIKRITDLLDIL